METDEGGELRRGEHVMNQNTDSPWVVTTILLICIVLLSCYHCEAALIQSVL